MFEAKATSLRAGCNNGAFSRVPRSIVNDVVGKLFLLLVCYPKKVTLTCLVARILYKKVKRKGGKFTQCACGGGWGGESQNMVFPHGGMVLVDQHQQCQVCAVNQRARRGEGARRKKIHVESVDYM